MTRAFFLPSIQEKCQTKFVKSRLLSSLRQQIASWWQSLSYVVSWHPHKTVNFGLSKLSNCCNNNNFLKMLRPASVGLLVLVHSGLFEERKRKILLKFTENDVSNIVSLQLLFLFNFLFRFQIIRATVWPKKRLIISVRLQHKQKVSQWFWDYVRAVAVYPSRLFNHVRTSTY